MPQDKETIKSLVQGWLHDKELELVRCEERLSSLKRERDLLLTQQEALTNIQKMLES